MEVALQPAALLHARGQQPRARLAQVALGGQHVGLEAGVLEREADRGARVLDDALGGLLEHGVVHDHGDDAGSRRGSPSPGRGRRGAPRPDVPVPSVNPPRPDAVGEAQRRVAERLGHRRLEAGAGSRGRHRRRPCRPARRGRRAGPATGRSAPPAGTGRRSPAETQVAASATPVSPVTVARDRRDARRRRSREEHGRGRPEDAPGRRRGLAKAGGEDDRDADGARRRARRRRRARAASVSAPPKSSDAERVRRAVRVAALRAGHGGHARGADARAAPMPRRCPRPSRRGAGAEARRVRRPVGKASAV